MIPKINYVYSCTWQLGEDTYFNLVTRVSSTHVYGKCIYSTRPGYFDNYPDDFVNVEWKLSEWSKNTHKYATIIDLGHADTLPELFL